MKGNLRFIIGIVVFLIVVFIMMLNMPRQFRWSTSFHHDSDQPFGCKLFDQMLEASLPNGYQVERKTFPMLWQEKDSLHSTATCSYIVLSDDYSLFDSLTTDNMLRLARSGDRIFLGICDLNDIASDSLFLGFYYNSWFSLGSFRSNSKLDTLYCGEMLSDTMRTYVVPEVMLPYVLDHEPLSHVVDSIVHIDEDGDSIWEYEKEEDPLPYARDTLIWMYSERWSSLDDEYEKEPQAVLVHYSIGEGDIYVCPLYLFFTNYGMLEGYDGMIFDIMKLFADRPVVRLEKYMTTQSMWENDNSPTRHFLAHPPLKWALRLTMLAIVLFMVFTARRRQRIEPVVEEPKNRQMEFIQLIGTLYHQRHDNADLVAKKYRYFSEEVRRQTGIDITDDSDDEHTVSVLSEKTGLEQDDVRKVILRSRMAARHEGKMTDPMMRFYIDQMNRILKNL